jgi:hypothetical protein
MEELVDKFAIRIARGANSTSWGEWNTEEEKEFWRKIVRDLLAEYEALQYERLE